MELGLCAPSAAAVLGVAEDEDDDVAVPLAAEPIELVGYADPRGLISNCWEVA